MSLFSVGRRELAGVSESNLHFKNIGDSVERAGFKGYLTRRRERGKGLNLASRVGRDLCQPKDSSSVL